MKVIVVGGGAAGMMAALWAAKEGDEVTLLEQNEKLGKKLFITGKGRCNITNAADIEEFFPAVSSNPKFLYSAFYSFTNSQTIDFFENLGVRTKVERGGRVFPESDHSSDVIRALEQEMGKPLLVRGSKGSRKITLTEEGMLLRKRAEEILELVRKTENEITLSDDAIAGDVYIGAGETRIMRLIARAACDLQKECPDIHCHISSGNARYVM